MKKPKKRDFINKEPLDVDMEDDDFDDDDDNGDDFDDNVQPKIKAKKKLELCYPNKRIMFDV